MLLGDKIKEHEMSESSNTHLRSVYKIFIGKPEGKRPPGRPRHRREINIRMDIREIGWEFVNWINLAQDRDQWLSLINTVMNLRVS
jgi:hypothetical protein